jgi:hypothetical protein
MKRFPFRWGAFEGIDGLPLIIVFSNALVFLFDLLRPGLIEQLVLSRAALADGQWWRLCTFVFVPPFIDRFFFWPVAPPANVVLMVFWFMFLYTMATSLERAWGGFRFTVYFLAGALATALVGFLPWPGIVGNGYLQASLFLAFATLFPEEEVLLFFFLPVRVRWLGLLTWASIGAGVLFGDGLTRATIAAGLLNYFLILGPDLWDRAILRWRAILNRRRFRGGP